MTIRATWAFNGQTKTILGIWHRLWCLLFGPLYYLLKATYPYRDYPWEAICRDAFSTGQTQKSAWFLS